MMNKFYKILTTMLLVLFSVSFCTSSQTSGEGKKVITAPDSLWRQFIHRLEIRDAEFLVNNSLDTIQCADCNLNGDSDNEYYEARFVFENHIDKLMHLKSLKDKDYYIYQDDSLMHIVYGITNPNALDGGYNLIFNFTKVGEKYLFKGMIVTP